MFKNTKNEVKQRIEQQCTKEEKEQKTSNSRGRDTKRPTTYRKSGIQKKRKHNNNTINENHRITQQKNAY